MHVYTSVSCGPEHIPTCKSAIECTISRFILIATSMTAESGLFCNFSPSPICHIPQFSTCLFMTLIDSALALLVLLILCSNRVSQIKVPPGCYFETRQTNVNGTRWKFAQRGEERSRPKSGFNYYSLGSIPVFALC